MKYLKIFSMIMFIIGMLITLIISISTFGDIFYYYYQQIGKLGAGIFLKNMFLVWIYTNHVPSIIFLIGFIFLLIYIVRTKNIYSLIASLFITSSSLMVIWFLMNIITVINRPESYSGLLLIPFIISTSIGLIILIAFITLFFFFRSKSKKYIEVRG